MTQSPWNQFDRKFFRGDFCIIIFVFPWKKSKNINVTRVRSVERRSSSGIVICCNWSLHRFNMQNQTTEERECDDWGKGLFKCFDNLQFCCYTHWFSSCSTADLYRYHSTEVTTQGKWCCIATSNDIKCIFLKL